MKSETKLKLNTKLVSIIFLVALFLSSFYVINTVLASEKETYSFITKWGYTGSGEGQFNNPTDVAVDSFGNVFVVDKGNSRIQKFSNDGTFILEWGTKGSEIGQFNSSTGIAIDNADNVYITDYYNNRIQKFNNNGVFLTKFNAYHPIDVAIDKAGNLYIPNYSNNSIIPNYSNDTLIQKFNSNGIWLASWKNPGYPYPTNVDFAYYRYCLSIEIDNAGYIYVLDTSAHGDGTWRVLKFDGDGVIQNTWYGGGFEFPTVESATSLAVDNEGFIYIIGRGLGMQASGLESDVYSDYHVVTGVNKYTNSGKIVTRWGNPGSEVGLDGSSDGQFWNPQSVAVDSLGNVFVADTGNNRIQKFAKIPDSSVRGNWFFDENVGEIVHDNSFYSNTGLIYGASWINGVSGSALNFDGIDDYVSVADSASLRPQHFTVKAWVKLKSDGTYHYDSTPLTKGWGVLACSFTNSFMPQAFFGLKFIDDESWTTLTSTETFPLDRWLPVVYMYDGTFMKIFVNGEEKASLAKIGIIDWTEDELIFGANNWGGYDYSIIDEVRFYDKPYPYPAENIVTETIRPWWQISLTEDGLSNTQQIDEGVADYDTTYFSIFSSQNERNSDYSFILTNLTTYSNYIASDYLVTSVTVNVVAKNIGMQSSFLNLSIETWGEKYSSPNLQILVNEDYTPYSYTWNHNPATNLNWTKKEVNDLHASFSVNTNDEVRVTQLYVEVKFPELTRKLIDNADFKNNSTSGWGLTIFDPNKEGYSGTLKTSTDAYSDNYSALFTVTNHSTTNTGYIIARIVVPSSSTVGKMFKLEFYYKGSMIVYPDIYVFNDTYVSGTYKKLIEVFNGPACLPTDSWTYVSMVYGPTPSGTRSVELHFDVASTGDFYFDNVNVTKITTIDYPWIPS